MPFVEVLFILVAPGAGCFSDFEINGTGRRPKQFFSSVLAAQGARAPKLIN